MRQLLERIVNWPGTLHILGIANIGLLIDSLWDHKWTLVPVNLIGAGFALRTLYRRQG